MNQPTCSLLSAPTLRICCPVRPGVWWGNPMAWAGGNMAVDGVPAVFTGSVRSDSFLSRLMYSGGI